MAIQAFHSLKQQFSRRPSLCYSIVLTLLVFVFFSPALQAEFLNWDDNYHVFSNRRITSLAPADIRGIFLSSVNGTYIPLTILSFALEYKLFNLHAPMYHFDNLLLHLLTVLLIFRLGLKLRLSDRTSFIAAAIFAVHPMHVESVMWVTERKDVLYAFFYVLAINAYIIYVRGQKGWWYILSLMAAGLSVLAKPMALSLPWILLLIDWFLRRPWSFRILLEKIPFLLAVEPIALVTYTLNARAIEFHLPENFLIWVWSVTFYIEKFFFPVGLRPIYWLPFPLQPQNLVYIKAEIILALFIAVTVWLRRDRWFMFAVLYFVGSAFFLWRYDYADVSVVADRFMYLPSLGFCFFGAVLLERVWSRFLPPTVSIWKVAAPVILILGVLTFKQALVWQKDTTFWETFFYKHPNKLLAYSHVSSAMVRNGKYDMALDYFNQLIKLFPNVGEVYNNRGMVYQIVRAYDLAMADFNKAIELNPRSARSYNNRGCLYRLLGNYDLALNDLNTAIKIDKNYANPHYNKGFILSIRDDYPGALASFNEALRLDPGLGEAYNARGFIYILQNETDLALSDFHKAVLLNPRNIFALSQSAYLMFLKKEYDKALVIYEEILRVSADNAPAFYERSLVYEAMGRYSDALLDAWKARSLGYAVDSGYLRRLEEAVHAMAP